MNYDENWQFNLGQEGHVYISENQHRTGISMDSVYIYFSFLQGTVKNPSVRHDVKIPIVDVIGKYEGQLSEALAVEGYREYLVFKEKFRNEVAYDMGDGINENTINK